MEPVTVRAQNSIHLKKFNVTVDPQEVLEKMDFNDILWFVTQNKEKINAGYDYKELAMQYFHGDFDLKALFKEIGIQRVKEFISREIS
jgi:hypothetical protein